MTLRSFSASYRINAWREFLIEPWQGQREIHIRKNVLQLMLVAALMPAAASAESVTFDHMKPGQPPAGWLCGVTGSGSPHWLVETDISATSKPNVLMQSGVGTFPWCVRNDVSIADGFIEVKFKPQAGSEDQAGGLVWRWKDASNYYVVRANALEDNVTLYRTISGSRQSIKSANRKVAPHQWHTMRVEFHGIRYTVKFDGQGILDGEDDSLSGPGAVGVWTKADSVTLFDDFTFAGN